MIKRLTRTVAGKALVKIVGQASAQTVAKLEPTSLSPQFTPIQNPALVYRQIQNKISLKANPICRVKLWPSQEIPKLVRKPDDILIKYWWSEAPFDQNQPLFLPIFSLETNEFTNQAIELEQLIFNQPVRRDIVHRVLHWSLMFGKRTTHRTKTPADVAGSGKKPRAQKKSGRARMGSKRASGRRHGGKIFGHVPKDFTFHLPEKVKIKGLISCLSAKLAEGKVRIYDTEKLADFKTKHLKSKLPNAGHKETYLFVTPKVVDRNFFLASKNIDRVRVVDPNHVCVRDLLKFDKVIFTVQSLQELTELLLAYTFMLEKPKAVRDRAIEDILNLNYVKSDPDQDIPQYDPESNWEPRFEILKNYYELYRQQKAAKGKQEADPSSVEVN